MKKTYINPTMEIVTIQTQQMLASSLDISEKGVDGSKALGRDYDFDDDEE